MLTRTLTKHATGNIIKISLMMNFQAPVIGLVPISAAADTPPRGNLSRAFWRIGSRTRAVATPKALHEQQNASL
jgi:hypothetical protein